MPDERPRIDQRPAASWTEDDLQELCDRQQRERSNLEFKGELSLARDRDKNSVEKQVQGMANAGGGYIIFGVAEAELPDGSRVAGSLTPLSDGNLYDDLNNVLDSRGEPPVLFTLYAIVAQGGGMYLVIEISGRRRPHMAHHGRYYLRRNLLVRQMKEHEVAEAYRDRFRRERGAEGPSTPQPPPGDLPPEAVARIHRGLHPGELTAWREETGDPGHPGWLSVVVLPEPLQANLVDPLEMRADDFYPMAIEPRWNPHEAPLTHFDLTRTPSGFFAQLPPRDDVAPKYLVAIWHDGLMEFGDRLEPALREPDPARNRWIPTMGVAQYIHDYLRLFVRVFDRVGWDGQVVAQVSFDHVHGAHLGLASGRDWRGYHPLAEDQIRPQPWRGSAAELDRDAGRITKRAMDELLLAAGIQFGFPSINREGELVE